MNSNLMGSNSILEFSDNLKKLKKELINQNNKIYVDSGGYSIIKGDVRFDSTKRFIECYNYFILNESSSCDRIFSLDIPFWGNIEDSMYMSKFNLEKYNDLSTDYLTKSISINRNCGQITLCVAF
jgi:type VI protein secretion system component Hcp